jgi:cation transport regulator ChaB
MDQFASSAMACVSIRRASSRRQTGHRIAWAAVKRKYRKSGDRWISRKTS